jgi:hypothetical protein
MHETTLRKQVRHSQWLGTWVHRGCWVATLDKRSRMPDVNLRSRTGDKYEVWMPVHTGALHIRKATGRWSLGWARALRLLKTHISRHVAVAEKHSLAWLTNEAAYGIRRKAPLPAMSPSAFWECLTMNILTKKEKCLKQLSSLSQK